MKRVIYEMGTFGNMRYVMFWTLWIVMIAAGRYFIRYYSKGEVDIDKERELSPLAARTHYIYKKKINAGLLLKFWKAALIVALILSVPNYLWILGKYHRGNVKSVTGYVNNIENAGAGESFQIEDVTFSCKSPMMVGFDERDWAYIHEGQHLEVHYIRDIFMYRNVIVYIAWAEE